MFSEKITFNEIVGDSDELSLIMKMLVDDGSITRKRAYEIKKQLTDEYHEGKVQEKDLLVRLTYLKIGIDIPRDMGVLRQTINSNLKLCPYCFQPVDETTDSCPFCGYDLIHDEELDLTDVRIVDSIDQFDLSSFENFEKNFLIDNPIDEEDEDDVNITELFAKLEKEGLFEIFSFDESHSNDNSPEIDLFSILLKMDNGCEFFQAYSLTLINSGLSEEELYDMAIKRNFIKNNLEITEKGYKFVINNDWMFFYEGYLNVFNFDDFNHFYKQSKVDLNTTAINFLIKHIKIAHQKRDFNRLVAAYAAKGHVYDHMGKYRRSLRFELKVFILNLNPLYLDGKKLLYHVFFDDYNIDTLRNFNKVYSLRVFKKYFNTEWNKIEFEKIYVPKNHCWKILNDMLKGADLNEYMDRIDEKYFSHYYD